MLVRAIQQFDMQVASSFARERPPEMFYQFNVQLAYAVTHVGNAVHEKSSPAQVNDRTHERLIHWHIRRAKSHNAAFITQRFGEGLPHRYRNVLNRMMPVNIEIARAGAFQIEHS